LRPGPPVLISLDPPYRLAPDASAHVFAGWAEVDDPGAPDIRLSLNGVDVPVATFERPNFQAHFAGVRALGFRAGVDLAAVLRRAAPEALAEPVLLLATVTSGSRTRTFEYAVSDEWLARTLGRPMRARRIPPEHLQVRVTGAAAGAFHAAGAAVAGQVADILGANGRPLTAFRRILDFGCGPGRVISSVANLHPAARLSGCDIDAEAIAWARENLGDVADFRVNPPEPPLPFADESFDLVYAISIFTHLPEEMQWGMLSELRRILRPGGVLLTTKLNPAAYDLPPEVKQAGLTHGYAYWGSAEATQGLPGFYRLAYHTEDYVRGEWGRWFEVLHVGAHDLNNTQDAVLLRRPRHGLSWLPGPLRRGLHRLARA
jgi:SAM-dependent methyltransferase